MADQRETRAISGRSVHANSSECELPVLGERDPPALPPGRWGPFLKGKFVRCCGRGEGGRELSLSGWFPVPLQHEKRFVRSRLLGGGRLGSFFIHVCHPDAALKWAPLPPPFPGGGVRNAGEEGETEPLPSDRRTEP